MKSRNLIIKIAFGVSAAALLFSLVTLIRSLVIGASAVFPIIQVVGSGAIFGICFWMFRVLPADAEDEDGDDEPIGDENEIQTGEDQPEKAVDELYEKYHLSEFEEK
ncbi:MAG: hypothetical protein IJV48_00600 [Ruminococcus sp.]|nr:hypothetical protein [Ruminococcus sp.]